MCQVIHFDYIFAAVQWETECAYVDATCKQFVDWLAGQCRDDNPLLQFHLDTHWCYADYKYMSQLFAAKPHLLKVRHIVKYFYFGLLQFPVF